MLLLYIYYSNIVATCKHDTLNRGIKFHLYQIYKCTIGKTVLTF